jgi:hypothetical protein
LRWREHFLLFSLSIQLLLFPFLLPVLFPLLLVPLWPLLLAFPFAPLWCFTAVITLVALLFVSATMMPISTPIPTPLIHTGTKQIGGATTLTDHICCIREFQLLHS